MERVAAAALVDLVSPYALKGNKGRRHLPCRRDGCASTTHAAVVCALELGDGKGHARRFVVPWFASFGWDSRLPDTILRFRHLLEMHNLADQIMALVMKLSSGRGLLAQGRRRCHADRRAQVEQEQGRQSNKGTHWFFGMKAHIGVHANSGLVYTVRGTAAGSQ